MLRSGSTMDRCNECKEFVIEHPRRWSVETSRTVHIAAGERMVGDGQRDYSGSGRVSVQRGIHNDANATPKGDGCFVSPVLPSEEFDSQGPTERGEGGQVGHTESGLKRCGRRHNGGRLLS